MLYFKMNILQTFNKIDKLTIEARNYFRKNFNKSQKEFENIFSFCFIVIESISKFYAPNEWEDSQQGNALGILIQCLETILAMYYLTESGFWDNALILKRNYSELLSVAIAIGYDKKCYVDWKNNRDCFNNFTKIKNRIEKSNDIPEIDKKLLVILKKYWNESSQKYSHSICINSIRTLLKSGKFEFEPKIAKPFFQQKRLRTFRNMVLNVLSIILGIFKYGKVTESRKKEFPEALNIIKQSNIFFNNTEWKQQTTV